ncbi:heterokaryon incompatibility protein-domain-containing protein [Dactylonectria macrodidyma]|uniref:Heterokaryon incompatibility protein-domain-containing protein n=1 Tax=Dactylonectria macrodidyma TaxID=307937 RepID=A0A9P9JBG0_9HYPO|nr:heterokaryon incompatibility protein-domain-containing protein [Dactylonectria macrodidyma]
MWPCNSPKLGPVSSGFYNKLELSYVRILRLHHGSGQDDITCTLEKRLLPARAAALTKKRGEPSQPPDLDCTTLSYEWGNHPERNLRKIQCNRVGFHVTSNLYSALVHLRNPDSDISLWIDAICIDQGNSTEKGEQIQRMGEIYSRSKCTIIWLGDGGFLSREAFRACSMLAATSRHQGGLDPPSSPTLTRPWDPFGILHPFLVLLLLRRSYFTRTWIIQEVALSNSIEIACGNSRISWCDFTIGAATMLVAPLGSKSAAGIGNILVARTLLPWAAHRGWIDPAWIFQTMTQGELPQTKNILSMATLFKRSHAKDPVDKLFGLLGLCEQIREGSTYGISPTYSPNDPYHKNRVYVSTSRTILFSQNSLQIFSAVNRRPPNNFDFLASFYRRICFRRRQTQALPTWVPDWSDTGSTATPLSLMLAQNNTVGTEHNEEYHFVSYQQSSHRYSPYIWLSGRCVDNIGELGEVCDTEKAQSSIWFSIRYSFTMSENHRLEIFGKWERQFRIHTPDESFWENFISTVTCGSSNTYVEDSIMRLLTNFRSRSWRNLPTLVKSIFVCLFILPLAIVAWTGSGIVNRIMIYWCFPVVAISSMWYWCFQLTPNFMLQEGWEDHGVEDGFLKSDFDNMELRRLARLTSGSLALVPEASCIGDQIWSCKGGTVPLVLRSKGYDSEMVGECYLATATAAERLMPADSLIRLI